MNALIIFLLQEALYSLSMLEEMVEQFEDECTINKITILIYRNEVRNYVDIIKIMEQNLDDNLTGMIGAVYDFQEPYIDSRLDEVSSYLERFETVLMEDKVVCGKKTPRLHGRLYFVRAGLEYVQKIHEGIEKLI